MAKPTQSGSITILNVGTNSVYFEMEPIPGATGYQIAYRRPSDTSAIYRTSSSTYYTITGLNSGTTYIINYRGHNNDGYGPFMSSGETVTTEEDTPIFEPFDWTYAGLNSNGSPVYGSTKRAGYGVYVTAAEWNELARLVEEVTGMSVSTVSRGDPISAAVVNSMARALGVNTVSKGDAISASFFNALRSAYNALG